MWRYRMTRRHKLAVAAVAVLAVGGVGAGYAIAGGGDDTEGPITGDALVKAKEAALEHTGGGRVSGTEVGDEESLYEVEVTLADGSQVDVQLDESFKVVGQEGDSDSTEDENGSDDD
jgi:uncharacterized membrane protein YkoI